MLAEQSYWSPFILVCAFLFFGLLVICLPRTRKIVASHKRKGQRRRVTPKHR